MNKRVRQVRREMKTKALNRQHMLIRKGMHAAQKVKNLTIESRQTKSPTVEGSTPSALPTMKKVIATSPSLLKAPIRWAVVMTTIRQRLSIAVQIVIASQTTQVTPRNGAPLHQMMQVKPRLPATHLPVLRINQPLHRLNNPRQPKRRLQPLQPHRAQLIARATPGQAQVQRKHRWLNQKVI